MNGQPERLNGDEVINLKQTLIDHDTFKSSQFFDELKKVISNVSKKAIPHGELPVWLTHGIKCHVLSPNKNWREGKLKIRLELEFIPDEPDPKEENKTPENQSLNDFRN